MDLLHQSSSMTKKRHHHAHRILQHTDEDSIHRHHKKHKSINPKSRKSAKPDAKIPNFEDQYNLIIGSSHSQNNFSNSQDTVPSNTDIKQQIHSYDIYKGINVSSSNSAIDTTCDVNDKPLKSILHYINDPYEMVDQMFSVLSSDQLYNITPSNLQHFANSELKKLCVNELDMMTNKLVKQTLAGINDSVSEVAMPTDECSNVMRSEIKTVSIESKSNDTNKKYVLNDDNHIGIDEQVVDSTSHNEIIEGSEIGYVTAPVTTMPEITNHVPKIESVSRHLHSEHSKRQKHDTVETISTEIQVIESNQRCEQQTNEQSSHKANAFNDPDFYEKRKMEILELELRARAIKAMLKKHNVTTTK